MATIVHQIVGKICPVMTRKHSEVRCTEDCAALDGNYFNDKHEQCTKEAATKTYQRCNMWP